MEGEEKRKKDGWDKAAILSTFISSVVIAAVGLKINGSIQEAQIASSARNAQIQADVAKQIAEGQKRLQEGTLTGQLVEHLASKDPLKRRIAIIALQGSVPQETYQRVVSTVVTSDESSDVRIAAYQQAASFREPGEDIARNIAAAAQDPSKPAEERQVAKSVSNKLQEARLDQTELPVYQMIYNDDPTLALAGLRIGIEKRLNDLATVAKLPLEPVRRSRRPLSKLVRELREHGVLSHDQAAALADLLPLLNAATHSEEITKQAADWAMSVGPKLIAGLEERAVAAGARREQLWGGQVIGVEARAVAGNLGIPT